MALFFILPTTDIHLVRNQSITNGQQFTLNLKLYYKEFNENFLQVTVEHPVSPDPNPNLIEIVGDYTNSSDLKILINANQGIGFTFLRIRYDVDEPGTDDNPVGQNFQECFVRVWVHQDIEEIWINNNHLTIYSGNQFHGYVPSVFAKFTDTEIGDITYHPYLHYAEENQGTRLIVDNHIVKAPTEVQTNIGTKLIVSIRGVSILNDKVNVTITSSFNKPREILQKVHIGQPGPNKINLLIVGDGFTTYTDFKLYLDETVDKLLNNRILSPWNLLKDNLTIWAACEPTTNDKEGITINFPVAINGLYMPNGEGRGINPNNQNELSLKEFIKEVGLPNDNTPTTYTAALSYWSQINSTNLKEPVFMDWINYNTLDGYVENKDSVIGIRMGTRLGDNIRSHYTPVTKKAVTDWYYQSDRERNLGFDRRRYPESTNLNPTRQHIPSNAIESVIFLNGEGVSRPSSMDKYIGSLKYIGQSSQDEYDIAQTWQTFGKDAGNVIILSNHYKDAGTNQSSTYILSENANFIHKVGYSLLTLLSEKKLNISPTIKKKLDDNVSAKNSVKDIDAIVLAGVLGHEFMHSIFLGDEYEGSSEHPDPSDSDTIPNLATIYRLAKPGTGNIQNKIIDPLKIKWNLRRVALSSMIVHNITISGNILTVKLEAGQAIRWQKVLENDLPIYIRSSRFQPNTDIVFYERAISKITEIINSTDTIKLELKVDGNLGDPDLTLLNRGSHIYLPKRLNDSYINIKENPELFIINPRVFQHMINTSKPLSEKTNCYIESKDPTYPPADLAINQNSDVVNPDPNDSSPVYPEFSSPKNRFMVSGAYEGGGEHNCRVYRPSGWSLMRLSGLKEGYVYRTSQNGQTLVRDVNKTINNNNYSIYSRFDFFSKYFLVARFYPTKLEDLDRLEYSYYDSSNL